MKHDAALILKPTSLYFSITKKVQQLHGDFGVAAIKSGLAGMFIAVNSLSISDISVLLVRYNIIKYFVPDLPEVYFTVLYCKHISSIELSSVHAQ